MQIISTKKFDKQYKKLSQSAQQKFNKKIELISINLYHSSLRTHKLHGKFDDCLSLDVTGDLRAVFQIKEEGILLLFIAIGSHSELYS